MKDTQVCYLCGKPTDVMFNKNGYRIFLCASCGLGNTEFTAKYIPFVEEFYQKGYFMGDPKCGAFIDYKKDKPHISKNLSHILGLVKKYKQQGTFLDVGCAMGFLVEQAVSAGYDAYGLDPSSFALSKASKSIRGRLTLGTIEASRFPAGKFDVIVLHDVIEHLKDPISDLTKISTWLAPGGIILIATGNRESVATRILGRRWTFYSPPQHLFFFTKNTLTKVLHSSGCTPVSWFKVGKWLSLGYILHLAYVTSEVEIAKYFYRIASITRLTRMPIYIPLGDNMVVIARKQ